MGKEYRRLGALLIVQRIQEIAGDHPAILTGDFNVNDQSEAYRTLMTNAFVLNDIHKESTHSSGTPYTFYDFRRIADADCQKIDFIFVTPQIHVGPSFIPKKTDTTHGFPSDHNPQVTALSS